MRCFQPFIDEYDDEIFWDGLVDRLADRDFAETYDEAAKHMDQNERFEKISVSLTSTKPRLKSTASIG
jgi:hypothetical protein